MSALSKRNGGQPAASPGKTTETVPFEGTNLGTLLPPPKPPDPDQREREEEDDGEQEEQDLGREEVAEDERDDGRVEEGRARRVARLGRDDKDVEEEEDADRERECDVTQLPDSAVEVRAAEPSFGFELDSTFFGHAT